MSLEQATSVPARSGDWDRQRWIGYADRLLLGAGAWASPSGALVTIPGAEGGYGRAVDGLEGFARTLLLAGFRIAGERGTGVDSLIERAVRGITAGVDPDNPERWVRLTEHPQAKVEAASLALILDLTRPWVWDRLDESARSRIVDYLAPVVGDAGYPKTNWLWFRVVVQTFLRSVGGPWSATDIEEDLALHDSLQREDGWISDGFERSYDHYVGWALHLYPILWSRMQGAAALAAGRTADDVVRLDRYLQDALLLVGRDGSPLIQGRSLSYRFAAAAPFWAGALAEVPSIAPGQLRHAAARIVGHFEQRGVPDERDLLTIGWHGAWRRLAQRYTGPGSPYWAAKGLLGISLPADHPVWAAPAQPLPIDTADRLSAVRSPGWIISATRADGVVRVVNHGTDHALPGAQLGDSPLYARIGYSTATAPLHDGRAWQQPLEQSVALLDAAGNASHRTAIARFEVRIEDGVGIASSIWDAHWIEPDAEQVRHGSGIAGRVVPAGRLLVHSLVRGPWELRLARLERVAAEAVALRFGGWAIAGESLTLRLDESAAQVTAQVAARILPALGTGVPAIIRRDGASFLGTSVAVPILDVPLLPGVWTGALVELTATAGTGTAVVALTQHDDTTTATVTWPDDQRTTSRLVDLPYSTFTEQG